MTTTLVLLGTGTPNIHPQRYQSSLAIIVDDVPYIVDCGGGTVQRLSQAHQEKGIAALALDHVTRLFLTHLHPDHTVGLADFLISPWVLERDERVRIYGPPGTEKMVSLLWQAYEVGLSEHRDGLAPLNHPLQVAVEDIRPGTVYNDTLVTVEALPVRHGNMKAFAYKFSSAEKTIVLSGDTAPLPQLIDFAMGCDILVHEVYSEAAFASLSPEWQAYHRQAHTSTLELAQLANQVQPDLLVLTHQLYWGSTDDDLLNEIRPYYSGRMVSAQDLDIFS